MNNYFTKSPQLNAYSYSNYYYYYSNQPYYRPIQLYNQNLAGQYNSFQCSSHYQQESVKEEQMEKNNENFESQRPENKSRKKKSSKSSKRSRTLPPKMKLDKVSYMKPDSIILHLVLTNVDGSFGSANTLPSKNLIKNGKAVTDEDSNEIKIDIEIELDLKNLDSKE